MNKINMKNIGLSPKLEAEASRYPELFAGRVVSQYKDLYRVVNQAGELAAEISGKFRFETDGLSDFPAVGDFVLLDRVDDAGGHAIIHRVLARKSVFIRKAAGETTAEQVVAANIDVVFLCMSLNADFNLRRLERYLAVAWDSGALPVIVLTKADLCADLSDKLAKLETVACGVDVIVTSSINADGYLPVKRYLASGQTIAFIGSSGVGKSSLINRLAGKDMLITQEIRKDDKGRHTTTRRELIVLPEGVVIDTPGMRELGIERADVGRAFADIETLAAECRFHDCTHGNEPGCKVQQAIAEGILTAERLAGYCKLQKEAKYAGLNFREIEAEKIASMFASLGGRKNARNMLKEKQKNRRGY